MYPNFLAEEAGSVSASSVTEYGKAFDENISNRLVQNAIAQYSLKDISIDRSQRVLSDHFYSHQISKEGILQKFFHCFNRLLQDITFLTIR